MWCCDVRQVAHQLIQFDYEEETKTEYSLHQLIAHTASLLYGCYAALTSPLGKHKINEPGQKQ